MTRCDAIDTDVQGYLSSVRTGDARWMIFSRNVKRIFEYLAKKEIKTILVLDEFDRAETLFQNETKRFELFRTLFRTVSIISLPLPYPGGIYTRLKMQRIRAPRFMAFWTLNR